MPIRRYDSALPPYFGGKRRLRPLIFALIHEQLPRCEWGDKLFLDPFCGGGSVALHAKAQGFTVLASDLAERSVVVARALIQNSSVRLRETDVLDLFRKPSGDYPHIAEAHVPAIFHPDQAAWLDGALARARSRPEPVRSLLRLVIIKAALRRQPMSMLRGTDTRAAITGDFDRVSPRRLGHYLREQHRFTPAGVKRLAEEVNAGVLGGRGEARQADALAVIRSTEADVLYLDPPYPNTTGYAREYAVLDEMLGDTTLRDAPIHLDDLLLAAAHIPLVVLSYGGPTTTLDRLVAQVGRHRPVPRAVSVPYRHLGPIASEEKNATNREFIVVAGR